MAEQTTMQKGWVIYPIGSRPKMALSFFLGLQHYLTMFGATVSIPLILSGAMKMPPQETALLISTIFLASGIATLLQQYIGNRLPIVQGGSFSFLGPAFAIIALVGQHGGNWQNMIQTVSTAILFGSFFEIILGYSGLMGQIKKVIGPITIAPTITMIGLSLFGVGAPFMAGNWTISVITLIALILYSQVFARKSRVFLLFPVLLAILTGWILSLIGTLTGIIPPGNPANLAKGLQLIHNSPWFWIRPIIPFKWGFPPIDSVVTAGAIGTLAGYIASMVESIGDYHSCARIAEGPVPTARMISKGLGAEGVGCLVAGILQTGNGTTSYTENIGAIGITRVASRRVIKAGATIAIVIPFFAKFGAILATLPQPVVGAMYVGLFGLIAAVGLSNLQFVNLNNSRNLFILGLALFSGLTFPAYFNAHPIHWGAPGTLTGTLGDIAQTILTTGMAVSAFIAMALDNWLPGATREERGLAVWEREATEEAWIEAEKEWAKMKVGEERKLEGFEGSQS